MFVNDHIHVPGFVILFVLFLQRINVSEQLKIEKWFSLAQGLNMTSLACLLLVRIRESSDKRENKLTDKYYHYR